MENLLSAWQEFRLGKSSRLDVMEFEHNLEDNLFSLHEELKNNSYKHSPYHTFHIYDPKHWIISKATVKDRIVQHLIFKELYNIFDPTFIYHSYSSRLGKGTHLAVQNLAKATRTLSRNYTKPVFALKCDVKKFFASVSHQKLLGIIKRKIKNSQTSFLIEEIITSFPSGGGDKRGLPIGNVTSQIFANIYLNELDQFIKHKLKVKYYFRYADDFVLLSCNQNLLRQQLKEIALFLTNELSLVLHPEKVSIKKYNQGIDFLGYVILPHHIVLRTKTKKRMFKKIKEKKQLWLTGEMTAENYNQTLQSYLGLLKHCNGHELEKIVKRGY